MLQKNKSPVPNAKQNQIATHSRGILNSTQSVGKEKNAAPFRVLDHECLIYTGGPFNTVKEAKKIAQKQNSQPICTIRVLDSQ
jgi:hypothetical protein